MTTRRVAISRDAARDIDRISDDTIERWGNRQARTYVATLRTDIDSLSEFAERFPFHTGRYAQLRKMRSGHHLIFYGVTDDRVLIVRVLHERMDVDRAKI